MNIVLFNTAIGTSNIGDEIIQSSLRRELETVLLDKSFVIEYATHVLNFTSWQYYRSKFKRSIVESANLKLVMGTNLLSYDLFKTRRQWVVNPFNRSFYKDVVLAGVGTTMDRQRVTAYSRWLYRSILSKDFIHSVRDQQSADLLSSIGVRVINTGCPTLWCLNHEHCKTIPRKKGARAVISVSGYKFQRDPVRDLQMLNYVFRNYGQCWLWCQTSSDEEYFDFLTGGNELIGHRIYSLHAFRELLSQGDIDYIGTRLHGGVFALQNHVRTIVIAVDHRARGFRDDNSLPVLERHDISMLDEMINDDISTDIRLDEKAIEVWKGQFERLFDRS